MDDQPALIDPTSVPLSPRLLSLTEELARHAHEVWARKRREQGWKYGPQRDDARKLHPDLVPYEQLSESEKEYDRNAALETLRALVALGWQIEPPGVHPAAGAVSQEIARDLATWQASLAAGASDESRRATFDMDDRPENVAAGLPRIPELREALSHLQKVVYPAWEKFDRAARRQQYFHRLAATIAIIAGTASIFVAVVESLLPRRPEPSSSWAIPLDVTVLAVVVLAVGVGLVMGFGDRWLTVRQIAERLRLLKFAALGWPEMWCDPGAWRGKVSKEVQKLEGLKPEEAEKWAKTASSEPALEWTLDCPVPEHELRALVSYYQAKRQNFQTKYFDTQAQKHRQATRWNKPALPVSMFALSVGAGAFHVLLVSRHAPEGSLAASLSLGIATLLPVLGFGIRAWTDAFELPRRASLFEAKRETLRGLTARLAEDAGDARLVLRHIAICEFVLEEEHREWCRLQLGTEWIP